MDTLESGLEISGMFRNVVLERNGENLSGRSCEK